MKLNISIIGMIILAACSGSSDPGYESVDNMASNCTCTDHTWTMYSGMYGVSPFKTWCPVEGEATYPVCSHNGDVVEASLEENDFWSCPTEYFGQWKCEMRFCDEDGTTCEVSTKTED